MIPSSFTAYVRKTVDALPALPSIPNILRAHNMLSMSHPRPANLLDQRFNPAVSGSRELACALALVREGVYLADLSVESWDAFCRQFPAPQAPAAS